MFDCPSLGEGRVVITFHLSSTARQRANSISVTDVQTGLWCEMQAEYRYLHQYMKHTNEWRKLEEKGTPVQFKTPEMRQGTDLHLAKGN